MKTINLFSHTDFVIDIVFQHEKKDSLANLMLGTKIFQGTHLLILSAQPVSYGGINKILHID